MFIEQMFLLLAVICSLLGTFSLRHLWRRRLARHLYLATGWGLCAAAIFLCSLERGVAEGLILGVLLIGASGLAACVMSRTRGAPGAAFSASRRKAVFAQPLKTLARNLLIFPASLFAALSLSLVCFIFLPVQEVDRLIAACFLTVAAWGGCATIAASDPKLGRAAGIIFVLFFVGGVASLLGLDK